jgi:hypothetical protein
MEEKILQIDSDNNIFRINYLDPQKVKLFRQGDILRCTIDDDRTCLRVIPMRAFPISIRDEYISLRDMKGNELGIIKEPKELDKESRSLLEEEIQKRYFTPVIRRIISIRDKMGIVEWEIETDRGMRKFITRSIHHSIEETGTGFMIKDMEGNRYELRSPSDLDPVSAGILANKI